MPKLNFTPQTNGFHFSNYFVNVIANLPGIGQISTFGRCGGMSYLALDHYFAHKRLPQLGAQDFAQTDGVPPDGHPLADDLYQRQLDSFMTLSAVKFVAWTLLSDENSWFSKGVSHLTKVDEFAKLKASIDRGSPVTLGLIVARDLAHLGSNHQIIAYGYDETPDTQTVYIYDVNFPNHELTLISANNALGWREDDDALKLHLEWRGWFIQDYKPKRPPANLDRLTITKRKAKTKAAVAAAKANAQALLVTLTSITFHNDDDKNATDDLALSFDIGGQTWRWPSGGTKTVEDGKRYRLNKSFSLSVFAGGSLNISARPAFSDAHQSAVNEGLLESNDAPLDNEPAGLIFNSFMVKDKWGIGEHSARSSGAGGAYTLVYSVSVA